MNALVVVQCVCMCVYVYMIVVSNFPRPIDTTADIAIAKRDWAPYIYIHVIQPQHCNT